MIQNLWSITQFYCGCHDNPTLMRLQHGPASVFYACPEYDKKYHGEKGCPNRVSTETVEQILNKISEIIEESEQNGEEINLTNYRFTYKTVDCVITYYSPFSIQISLKNKRAFIKK